MSPCYVYYRPQNRHVAALVLATAGFKIRMLLQVPLDLWVQFMSG